MKRAGILRNSNVAAMERRLLEDAECRDHVRS
jgi:hypothetical protein